MKNRILYNTIIFAAITSQSYAQTSREDAIKRMTDSLTAVALSEYAIRYPQLRQGFITTDVIGNSTVKGELNGNGLYQGKTSITRVRSNFSIPISHWGKNLITGTISYQQERFRTNEIRSFDPQFPSIDQKLTKTTVGFTATYSRSDSIFNKVIIYSGGISGVTDEFSSIKRVNYLGTVSVPLSRTQYSSLTVGLVVIIDPSAVAPVVPIISYWRKYKESELELFLDLPSRIVLRKQLSKRSWTSFGSELGNSLLFFKFDQPQIPQNSIYTSIEVRTGATFEYLLTRKLIFGVNGGVLTTASPKMFDQNDKPADYFYKSKNSTAPFMSFSLSFLPFLKL
ncbi:hypothetical protein [Pedobacter nyackensis]|uniref:hypothetical protein n=1 Tax=Pedobacter nyackensis TaxID=475255 RepID=UPI00292E4C10|nr:hypothetical protein [Pedobacter nyackensis]